MSYVYADAENLKGEDAVGTRQCVALVKRYAGAPAASTWRQGRVVKGDLSIAVGTAIATFVDGRYPNQPSGNHAALYVGQDAAGVWVIDQWSGVSKIRRRRLSFLGREAAGNFHRPSNNGDAFSVVE